MILLPDDYDIDLTYEVIFDATGAGFFNERYGIQETEKLKSILPEPWYKLKDAKKREEVINQLWPVKIFPKFTSY